MSASGLAELGSARFVSLATFRRDGTPVPTPVWVVPYGDGVGVMTPVGTAKTKRLARDPRVTLRECSRRGEVAPGAPTVLAHAVVDPDPAVLAQIRSAIARKYGLEYRIFMLVERIARRGKDPERIAIVITPAVDEDGQQGASPRL